MEDVLSDIFLFSIQSVAKMLNDLVAMLDGGFM